MRHSKTGWVLLMSTFWLMLCMGSLHAQLKPIEVDHDNLVVTRDYLAALPPGPAKINVNLQRSGITDSDGNDIHTLPGTGTFMELDLGEGVDVTINILGKTRLKTEAQAQLRLFLLHSGTLRVKGPPDVPMSEFPQIEVFSADEGAVFRVDGPAEVHVSNVRFNDNHAIGNGGVVSIDGGYLNLHEVWMDSNSADGNGGAISASGEVDVHVTVSLFENNQSGDQGGAVFFSANLLELSDSMFSGNTADDVGGHVDFFNGKSLVFNGNIGIDGVGSFRGDGFRLLPALGGKFDFGNSIVFGAQACNPVSVTSRADSLLRNSWFDNNGWSFPAMSLAGGGGLMTLILAMSRNDQCPRSGTTGMDSEFNVEAGSESCFAQGEGDILAQPIQGGYLNPFPDTVRDISLNQLRKTISDEIREALQGWGESETLNDRVPSEYTQPPAATQHNPKRGLSDTEAGMPGLSDNCPLIDIQGIARPQDGDGDGIPGCDAGPFERQNGVDIGAAQSGAFFDVNRDGEGVFVQMLNETDAVVYVFSFTPEGEQMWMFGIGKVTGNSIYFSEMLLPTASPFGPDYDPEQLSFSNWGAMSVHWPTCAVAPEMPGVMTFESLDENYGKARVSSVRLTQPVACDGETQHENAAWSGNYYLPEENGHGIVIEILPDGTVVMIWYLYDDNGNPRWVLGTGSLQGNQVEIENIYMPTGAVWGDGFNAADVIRQQWGSATLSFDSCSMMSVNYDGIQGQRNLSLTKLVSLAGTTCSP